MAVVGLLAGGLMGTILSGAFSRQDQTYKETTNDIVQALSSQMQSATQVTSQGVIITQTVNAQNSNITCGGNLSITNASNANIRAVGTFDVHSAAQVSNWVESQLISSIRDVTNVKTAFGSSLPSGTNSVQIEKNLTQIVQQVYTSENLNSMIQILQVNQTVNLQGATINAGANCNIGNISSAELLAQNSLKVLSESLFSNKLTSSIMNDMQRSYTGDAAGIFAPLSDFFSMIRWVAIAIVLVIGIVVVLGAVLRLLAASKGINPKTAGLDTSSLFALNSISPVAAAAI